MRFVQKWGGGGAYKHSSNNSGLRHYFATLNAEKQQDTHTNYKTEYKKQTTATQLVLWLLVFCVACVFAMTPIFNSKKSASLDAGQVNDGAFTNAPWVQVNTASKPLFTGNNTVDGEVLYDLLSYVNSTTVWNGVQKNNTTPFEGSAYTALTCEDFGKLDSNTNRNFAQLLVTLYGDTIIDSNNKAVQWQVVYRSMNDTSDVLTLYMNDIYKTTSMFDSTGSNNEYLKSDTLRGFVSTGTNSLQKQVSTKYGTSYLVAPKDVPSSWQSKNNQPDSDGSVSWCTNNGLNNVEDLLWVPSGYEVLSVLKNKNTNEWENENTEVSWVWDVKDTEWNNTEISKNDNLLVWDMDAGVFMECTTNGGRTGLWRMNGYDRATNSETWLRSGHPDSSGSYLSARTIGPMGDGSGMRVDDSYSVRVALHLNLASLAEQQLCKVSANSSFSSGTAPTCALSTDARDLHEGEFNYKNYIVPNNATTKGSATATFTERNSTKIKSFILKTETSSKTINVDSASGSGTASGVGDYSYTYSDGKLSVTVSNLSASTEVVASDVLTTNLNIVANNNSVNSLLILTIMDGSTSIAEYSCISGTISVSVTLEQKKTYKILATRPFGSRLTVLLNGATLAPTNFACYEISTGTNNAMNLSFTLTGDGSWKNCVVV